MPRAGHWVSIHLVRVTLHPNGSGHHGHGGEPMLLRQVTGGASSGVAQPEQQPVGHQRRYGPRQHAQARPMGAAFTPADADTPPGWPLISRNPGGSAGRETAAG